MTDKSYTQNGNEVIVTEVKEEYVSKRVNIAQLRRRKQQLQDIIASARAEIQEINDILKGVR